MTRKLYVAGPEELLQGLKLSRFAVNETAAIALVWLVTAVSRFVEGVRTEANEGFRRHQFFDDRWIIDVVDVIHDLCALIANPTVMFELCWTVHTRIVDGVSSRLASLRPAN